MRISFKPRDLKKGTSEFNLETMLNSQSIFHDHRIPSEVLDLILTSKFSDLVITPAEQRDGLTVAIDGTKLTLTSTANIGWFMLELDITVKNTKLKHQTLQVVPANIWRFKDGTWTKKDSSELDIVGLPVMSRKKSVYAPENDIPFLSSYRDHIEETFTVLQVITVPESVVELSDGCREIKSVKVAMLENKPYCQIILDSDTVRIDITAYETEDGIQLVGGTPESITEERRIENKLLAEARKTDIGYFIFDSHRPEMMPVREWLFIWKICTRHNPDTDFPGHGALSARLEQLKKEDKEFLYAIVDDEVYQVNGYSRLGDLYLEQYVESGEGNSRRVNWNNVSAFTFSPNKDGELFNV